AQGCKWVHGDLPTEYDCWGRYEEYTTICLSDNNILSLCLLECAERKFPNTPIIDYEIKKFKVGDRVRHKEFEWEAVVKHVYDNGSFGINDAPFFYYPESCELVEEPEKQKVPKCFDEWCRMNHVPSDSAVRDFCKLIHEYYKGTLNSDLEEWLGENPETALEALQHGYEVEQEPLYYVKLPSRSSNTAYLNHQMYNDRLFFGGQSETGIHKTKFTESEIRAFSPSFLEIAVKVEEDE
ncbi:DUF1642 domain-containing protein, partial [Listeria fleischmannii]|uniref:DUF1642 domain-containing protein n=1 Tax=Listeria fleischmannii TaxID=1069827 RepID=UPI0016249802